MHLENHYKGAAYPEDHPSGIIAIRGWTMLQNCVMAESDT